MTVAVSNTRRQVYVRIMNAMPEDAEVQTLCQKQIDQIDKQAAKTADKYQFVRERAAMLGVDGMSARDFARKLNENGASTQGYRFATQGASYYLRKMVADGIVEEVSVDKGEPKKYVYVG